jgi:hypothetical protein
MTQMGHSLISCRISSCRGARKCSSERDAHPRAPKRRTIGLAYSSVPAGHEAQTKIRPTGITELNTPARAANGNSNTKANQNSNSHHFPLTQEVWLRRLANFADRSPPRPSSVSRMLFPIIRRSHAPATSVSARAMLFAACSNASSKRALRPVWLAAKALPSMRA